MGKLIKLTLAILLSVGMIMPLTTEAASKSSSKTGLEVLKGAPTTFKNCTALKKYYPKGVKKGHAAYASKHDRDKDGWACEPY